MEASAGRAASPTARLALTVIIGLLVYASLFPNSGWSDTGIRFYDWVFAPLPRYWTYSEVAFNVAVYIPVGALLVWAWIPRLRGMSGVLVSTLLAALLSAAMESLQTFLPDRYASNLDFAANSAGAFTGAVLGWASAGLWSRVGWHPHRHDGVLRPRSHPALILVVLWLLVQIPPHAMLFGVGDVVGLFPQQMQRLESWLPGIMSPPPIWRVRAEALCTASAIVGMAMLLMHCLHPARWRMWLVPLLVMLALVLKIVAQPITLTAEPGEFAWLTPGALRGLLAGTGIAIALSFASASWQRRTAMLAIGVQLLVVNLFPADRYFLSTLATGYTGLLHLEELTRELALLWPYVSLGWMLLSTGSRAAVGHHAPGPGTEQV